ncbi:MAG: SH3 domain-containing protein [Beijerinckiaceae bacterium]|nr:SH3 domain-containing protein [Beijerinckiaceae bacterium]
MLLKSLVAATLATVLFSAHAQAQSRCKVMDPTGTPLNVRDMPNGKVIDQLPNGLIVAVVDHSRDRNGRAWAYVRDAREAEPLGWVFREFIACF